MMDRFESMSTFVAVVEAGGFSAAARKLGMPLATVSRKVGELEEQLKVRLLVRSTRSISLTDTGRDYFESCRRLLEDLAAAERHAAGEYQEPKGHLIVAAPTMLGRLYLAPIVIEFLAAYPEIHVELRLGERTGNMIDNNIDIAIRIGDLEDSSLKSTRLGEIQHVACASPAYLAEHGKPKKLTDLSDHDCITLLPWETPTEWIFNPGKRVQKIAVRSKLTVTTAETAVDAAVSGLGIAHLFCYQVSEAIANKRLALVLREFEPKPFPIHVVYPTGRHIPQKLRAFIDFAMPRLKAKLVFNP